MLRTPPNFRFSAKFPRVITHEKKFHNCEKELDVIVVPKTRYNEIFYLQAGWTGGFHPRPDTYTIACDVTYSIQGVIYHSTISIDVSIFPSLGSMLAGTLVGAILGTFLKELFSRSDIMKDINNLGLGGVIAPIIPILFSNLILGFLIAVVLMRKKDVQPFLTIEDFWGGILVGFLTSYTSSQLLAQISKIPIISST